MCLLVEILKGLVNFERNSVDINRFQDERVKFDGLISSNAIISRDAYFYCCE